MQIEWTDLYVVALSLTIEEVGVQLSNRRDCMIFQPLKKKNDRDPSQKNNFKKRYRIFSLLRAYRYFFSGKVLTQTGLIILEVFTTLLMRVRPQMTKNLASGITVPYTEHG
jgi:hypothetical protein